MGAFVGRGPPVPPAATGKDHTDVIRREHMLLAVLGQGPVKLLCERCDQALDRWSLDEQRGQLRPTTRAKFRAEGLPLRGGHLQVLDYICRSKTCRRHVVVSFAELEGAVIRALRAGRSTVQIGRDLPGRYRGEPVRRTTVGAKAPIPGGYRRAWAELLDDL